MHSIRLSLDLNPPHSHGLSPAQVIFGCPIRSHLPTHNRAFEKVWHNQKETANLKAKLLHAEVKERHNANALELPQLVVGSIHIQPLVTRHRSNVVEVIKVDRWDRRYFVKLESGHVYWHNRCFRVLWHFFPLLTIIHTLPFLFLVLLSSCLRLGIMTPFILPFLY